MALLLCLLMAAGLRPAQAYSQFTHEELIDILWADSIRPLLLERYPRASEAELRRAHAFAYGGSLVQDIGYYPFGKRFFSNLAHYVRSGDFVVALFKEARNLDDLAFAVGALSHYVGDSIGHSQAVNPATAIEFSKLKARYGPVVTYEEAPIDHIRTEFGFDVVQTALQRYAPGAYRKRSGFHVARPLLYRAFRDTYGISAGGILGPLRSALSTYRWSVTRLLPAFLHAEEVRLGGHLPAETEDAARTEFLLDISRTTYSAQFTPPYSRPGFRAHAFAVLLAMIPKIGKLKMLAIKAPDASTEDLFLTSMDHAVETLRDALRELREQPDPQIELANLDLDTGMNEAPGQSRLVDGTYKTLLLRIVREHAPVSPDLRRILINYYADPAHHPRGTEDPKDRRQIDAAVRALRESAGERGTRADTPDALY